ncbi:NAD(P)-dependent oxidoreductase [Spirillospora sp. CA-294931]|uniref:NAD(P)-dependent oxidoreductase n=1 Tax=Spirillospora sp. CA-294931 TaxID=3240042 RepID=UPI003D8DB295
MGKIVIFGAGGRAGRRAALEALRRGHEVTAVVRDPAGHTALRAEGLTLVAGDVADARAVAALAAGHDAGISAAVDLTVAPHDFFTTATRALGEGFVKAGVSRLLVVGLASVTPGASGALLMDEPGYPQEYRAFYLGHAAGLDELRATGLDWLYVAPAGDFDHDGPRTGRYRVAEHGDPASRISYDDFAIALLDEIDEPARHRALVVVREA